MIFNCLSIIVLFCYTLSSLSAQPIFISEVYFNPRNAQEADAIEIAGPTGANLQDWQLILYDGETGEPYDSHTFGLTSILVGTEMIGDRSFGTLVKSYGINGMKNRNAGVALITPEGLVQEFWSYGTEIEARTGPAQGKTSNNIGDPGIPDLSDRISFQKVCVPIRYEPDYYGICIDREDASQEIIELAEEAAAMATGGFEPIIRQLNELVGSVLQAEPPSTLPEAICWDCENNTSYTDKRVRIGYTTTDANATQRLTIRMNGSDDTGLSIINSSYPKTDDYGIKVFGNGGKAAFFSGDVDVSTMLYSKEIIVQTPPFPDYVFEADYPLMSLEEVENYIEQHQHLPNIPSAQEVETSGLAIGAFEVQQMEKIEEIFLHLIDLNKKVLQLEAENKALKAAMEERKP